MDQNSWGNHNVQQKLSNSGCSCSNCKFVRIVSWDFTVFLTFNLFKSKKAGRIIEDLLEIEFDSLDIFYVSWLWSKSCAKTSSFGVKALGSLIELGSVIDQLARNERVRGTDIVRQHQNFTEAV